MWALICALLLGWASAEGAKTPSILHFYQIYSFPIDGQNTKYSGDNDIGMALGYTLITYNRNGQMDAALANKWSVDPNNKFIDFELRPDLKWSDGKPITPHDILLSFSQLKLRYGSQYANVFDSYRVLEVRGPRTVRFYLAKNVEPQKFLEQIVFSQFNIYKTGRGQPDYSITTGAYWLYSSSPNEIILKVNKHYIEYDSAMFDEIHIRHSKDTFISAARLKADPWPDMVYVPTTISKTEATQIPEGAEFWRRPDRLIALGILDKRKLTASRALLRFARANAPIEKVAEDIFDGHHAKQVYPPAVLLHSDKDPVKPAMTVQELRKLWSKEEVTIAYDSIRIHPDFITSIRRYICGSLPVKCVFIPIPAADIRKLRAENKYDLVLSSFFVDPVEVNSPVYYYFEPALSTIPSEVSGKENFRARVKKLRDTGQGTLDNYRQLFNDAVEGGFFLPLVHHPSVVIGRKYIDFSRGEIAIGNPDFEDIRRRP